MVDKVVMRFLEREEYIFKSLIITTKNSTVIKVTDKNNKSMAIKVIERSSLNRNELNFYEKFSNIKGVIKLKKRYLNEVIYVYLVFDYYPFKLSNGVESRPTYLTKKKWVMQLLKILFDLETANIYHRDIKPDNILLEGKKIEDSNILLCDMGSITYDIELTRSCHFTPRFAPPELMKEKKNTKKTDIWCFGQVVLYIFANECLDPQESEEENFKILKNLCNNDDELYNLLVRCFSSPEMRASFKELINYPFITNTALAVNDNIKSKIGLKFVKASRTLQLLKNRKTMILKKIWVNSLHNQVFPCIHFYFRRVFENLKHKYLHQVDFDSIKQIDIKIIHYSSKENDLPKTQCLENLVQLYDEYQSEDKNDIFLKKVLKSALDELKNLI